MTKVYEMRRENWIDYFELHVSKTQKEMVAHVRKFYTKMKHPLPDDLSVTLGLCSPVATGIGSGPFAYLFCNEENTGVGVVAHECMHVAMARERFVNKFSMSYGEQCGPHEERLLYLFSDIVKGVYDTLYENKHIMGGRR